MPAVVEAILDTLLAAGVVAVALFLVEQFFQDVLDSSLLLCFSKGGWRDKPLSCALAVLIFLVAVVVIVSTFFGIMLYGSEPMPNDYDYIRSDEPYNTWP